MLRFYRHPLFIVCLFVLLPLLLTGCEGTDTGRHTKQDDFHPQEHVPYVRPATIIEALENPSSQWVDSVFNTLTPEQRIAQLMIIEAFSDKGPKYEADVMRLIKKYQVGGIIFFQGGPVRQAKLTNKYQAAANVPLLIAMDAETGVGMRLDSTVQYPFQQMLGAIEDNGLIYQMGAEVAEEFKRLGMHINFAPVADINNNAANPIIGYRSFGEDRLDVTAKSLAYMHGMQDNGILATAKHFPGHGDTDIDSHYDLPIIPYSKHRLDSLELYPFKELIKYGVGSIMVAHMHIPQLDSSRYLPSTLSKPIVTGLLKEELKFKGLIFTDAMVMKGVTKYFEPGEAEVRALMAGNDILERLNNVPKAIKAIKTAIRHGYLTQEEIDLKCKRVLAAKQWLGLHNYKPIDLNNLYEDLNPPISDSTNKVLAEAAITLLQNEKRMLPIKARRKARIATVSVGAVRPTAFQREAARHHKTTAFVISRKASRKEANKLRKQLRNYDVVLLSLYGSSIRPSNNLGYSEASTKLVQDIIRHKQTVTVLFENAYGLNQFPGIEKSRALIVAYQPLYHAQLAAARIVFGELPAHGRLPVTVNRHYRYGDGIRKGKAVFARR
ncbi:glycoside hydrolase family 3 C-terminal domain-containing protein [Pontibacter sp. Tf4]|uniref:glycoside hydrolase family 3 protein n=1 Tax=Pontibacter sp. Tf4 TaxID=2761620 RepID=UPI001629DEA4|nr:glycoside hydrolase family 3 N-terminal domain-containing protein [Pontibacter sp. Tf4]MBB6610757.1 glycoside hydrolase family 3 C-terminal domain-containing protein [Pontibacter sp. Tf4]